MSDGIYLDNDVVIKMCSYLASQQLVGATSIPELPPAILGLAQYTLRTKVERAKTIPDRDGAKAALDIILGQVRKLEPCEKEIEAAADLEQQAMLLGLALDAGESQLLAMLMERRALALATGDKRAIRSLAQIEPENWRHRIASFEQVISTIVNKFGLAQLRLTVCRALACDKAITACFQCFSTTITPKDVLDGLQSYTRSLRIETGEILVPSDDLSAIIP